MTLKEELEILRGEPIQVFDGDPMDIPCIETSDPDKLCKHPVVSVHMITFNHEPYIRQAIEGVMMQKTDFEFELIIGEDCSQDKTREICFEYQKKYPNKIRVLWWHENVSRQGGNSRRVSARCRGEFISFCEGDDYWIDPLKLQKQVDVFRANHSVSLVFCGAEILDQGAGITTKWNAGFTGFKPGLIPGRRYLLWTMFGKNPPEMWGPEYFVMTATLMLRSSSVSEAQKLCDICRWRLSMGDSVMCLSMGAVGDAYYIEDDVAIYRRTTTGVTHTKTTKIAIDTQLARLYFAKLIFGLSGNCMPSTNEAQLYFFILSSFVGLPAKEQRSYARKLLRVPSLRVVFTHYEALLAFFFLMTGTLNLVTFRIAVRVRNLLSIKRFPQELRTLYRMYSNV